MEQVLQQRKLTSTFPYALHEAPSLPRAIAKNIGVACCRAKLSGVKYFLR